MPRLLPPPQWLISLNQQHWNRFDARSAWYSKYYYSTVLHNNYDFIFQNPIADSTKNRRPSLETRSKTFKIGFKLPLHFRDSSLIQGRSPAAVLLLNDLPRIPKIVKSNIESVLRTPRDRQALEGAMGRQLRRDNFLSHVLSKLAPGSQQSARLHLRVIRPSSCSCRRGRNTKWPRKSYRKQKRNRNKNRRGGSTAKKNCRCKKRNYRLKEPNRKSKSLKR